MKKLLLSLAVSALAAMMVHANVKPASVFADHMVLQRNMEVPVWGRSNEINDTIIVSFGGQTVTTTVGEDGKWMVHLAPMSANATPQKLTISGSVNTVTVSDVLVGEVWLCSGQSNMEMPLWTDSASWRNYDGDKFVAEGANQLIRFTQMKPYSWSNLPVEDLAMTWAAMDTENTKTFSALAFFFSHELQEKLGIPIGLVGAYWGGTRIEPWTPPCGFNAIPELAGLANSVNARLPGTREYNELADTATALYQKWLTDLNAAKAEGKPLPALPAAPANLGPWTGYQDPTVIYNNMLYPFIPFAFHGAIWYQGCSNLGDGALYQYKMQALFEGWKKEFQNPDLKFYFVQLAPFTYGGSPQQLPVIWEAQENFCKANEPQVGMVVINDVGNLHDIHPHDKQTVGKRLAAMALNRTYGFSDLKPDFPRPTGCNFNGAECVITFEHVDEWKTKDDSAPVHFEVMGLEGRYVPADVTIKGTDLVLSAADISKVYGMRYMWNQTDEASLFNKNGLPLGAFRFSRPIEAVKEDVLADSSTAKTLLYSTDLRHAVKNENAVYDTDNSASVTGTVTRITYLLEAETNNGDLQWMVLSMDAFTGEAAKCGIPVYNSSALFQQKITNLSVITNIPGIKQGFFEEGNIEFWPSNYGTNNKLGLPGANGSKYDFDDSCEGMKAGYGSMQIHSFKDKQTFFAYNNFGNGTDADFGFGNSTGQHPDWTFSSNLKNYKSVIFTVYVNTK